MAQEFPEMNPMIENEGDALHAAGFRPDAAAYGVDESVTEHPDAPIHRGRPDINPLPFDPIAFHTQVMAEHGHNWDTIHDG